MPIHNLNATPAPHNPLKGYLHSNLFGFSIACASGSFACAYDYSKNSNIKSIKIINDGVN